ncbi:MAG TPA: radical SAM family heme chaperone HemW [Gemmatimonadaceae bacterium]
MLPRHVYVHVPFCARRCTYCDFSIAVRKVVPVDEYTTALSRELDLRFGEHDPWSVDTLYFGGGTPSRLGGEGVQRLVEAIRRRIDLAPDAELTLEANPEDVTTEAVRSWKAAGVNRLSIGSQSFDDRVLAWMHRTHDSAAIVRAVESARAGGIDNLSLDLIFALPRDIERSWAADVEHALELDPSHLSLYGLTVEPRTPLGRLQSRGELIESPDERYEAEFVHAHEALTAAGYDHYEVSNFGKPGRHSRHNAAYWTNVGYAGLGPSAHEFDGRNRRWNVAAYTDWLGRIGAGQDPLDASEELTDANRTAEDIYLGLRTGRGLAVRKNEVSRIRTWVEAGWATIDADDRIVLTALGWLRLDALAADLTLVRSCY